SRHRPDETLLIVPLVPRFHLWLLPPLQSQICTFAPAEALSGASRHLPSDCNVWPLTVHRWLAPPLQSQMMGCVPLVVLLPGTWRQRPEAGLTSVDDEPPVPMLPGTDTSALYQVAAILS